jgi:O-antigen ligase
VQRFQEATRVFYPERNPYVAHNTFLNFAANTGITNGLIYLLLYWLQFKRFRRIRKSETDPGSTMSYINNSTMVGLTGFYAGSMFLDLVIYEPFYFLLMLGLLTEHIYNKQKSINVETVKQDESEVVKQHG